MNRPKKFCEYNGERLAIKEIADRVGVSYSAMYNRLARGASVVEAMKPRGKKSWHKLSVVYNGETMALKELADRTGVPYMRIYYRVQRLNMSPEEAVATPVMSVADNFKRGRQRCSHTDCFTCPYTDCVVD